MMIWALILATYAISAYCAYYIDYPKVLSVLKLQMKAKGKLDDEEDEKLVDTSFPIVLIIIFVIPILNVICFWDMAKSFSRYEE